MTKWLLVILGGLISFSAVGKDLKLLNVSYDPTRELYEQINQSFSSYWKAKSGDTVTIQQSHGGSGKQSRAVLDGLQADVVTLALAYDIDILHDSGNLVAPDWQKRFPNNSAPFTSTIVFLVRKGNPKQIHEWSDLAKSGITIVTPNPKTSGGARWSYLAAYGAALKAPGGNPQKAAEFVRALYKNVPGFDTGARGATTTFIERGIGDILLNWENEAFLAVRESKGAGVEIVVPSVSILAEPPVSLVDRVVKKRGTEAVAREYLNYLYTEPAQEIAAKNYYRPRLESVTAKYANQFKKVSLFTVDEVFGGWKQAQKTHFDEGGTFDKIFERR